MKTLRDYIVNGALYQGGTGPEAQVGDQIKLFLDTEADPGFPEFVLGVIQHPIVKVQCETATSYVVEYDEADLLGAAALLRPGDVVDATIVSAVDALAEVVENHTHVSADITDASVEPTASSAVLRDTDGSVKARTGIILEDGVSGFVGYFAADEDITADRQYSIPDYDGTLGMEAYVYSFAPLTGATVTANPKRDNTQFASPAGTLAALTWNLPSAANARVGQVCRFVSTQTITAFTVSNTGEGATFLGDVPTDAVADQVYSFQCLSVAGSGTWVRL